ncbi:ABC transporter ATP-binding protein [Acetobacterium bakii]|uniref:ABC transporter ATP-binding protein n=1 Tax=Acetobacterium bakii TaxID=52689 RepID=UPI000680742F|nr:ABC transporter ATP-binding protein [Acetobacterium bakii]
MNTVFKEILLGVKRAISLIRKKNRRTLYLATFLMLLTGILANGPAIILGRLVDTLGTDEILFSVVVPFVLLLLVVIILREILTVIRKFFIENIATQTDKEQTVHVIDKLLKADIGGYLYQQKIGSLYGRIFRSIEGLVHLIKLTFQDFMPVFFTAVAAIGIAFLQKPLIASVMILVIPTGLYIIVKQVSSQKGIRVALLRNKEEVDGKVVEMLGGIETIHVMNTNGYEVSKIEKSTERRRLTEIKHHINMALYDSAKSLNEGIFTIVVIVVAIYMASLNMISRGDILVYAILFNSIIAPLREIHRILDEASESAIQVNDLFEILNQPIDRSFMKHKTDSWILEGRDCAVSIKNLSFNYDNPEIPVLNIEDLIITNGESIGIVGASGGGKTTLIHILLKLVHNYSGEVGLFNKNLRDVSRQELAAKVAYVAQKPFIFSGTIKDNIVYGSRRSISEDEMIEAARNAHIYEEIIESLGGFDGIVSENGNNLSGGQRQRLALARVMLQDPELIIFDEATSALDNTNEAIIQHNIERIFKNKTVITIAHRLTTLNNTDRILVFDEGEIVQEGDFKTLAEASGLFQDFLLQRSIAQTPIELLESEPIISPLIVEIEPTMPPLDLD